MPALAVLLPVLLPLALLGMVLALGRYEDAVLLPPSTDEGEAPVPDPAPDPVPDPERDLEPDPPAGTLEGAVTSSE